MTSSVSVWWPFFYENSPVSVSFLSCSIRSLHNTKKKVECSTHHPSRPSLAFTGFAFSTLNSSRSSGLISTKAMLNTIQTSKLTMFKYKRRIVGSCHRRKNVVEWREGRVVGLFDSFLSHPHKVQSAEFQAWYLQKRRCYTHLHWCLDPLQSDQGRGRHPSLLLGEFARCLHPRLPRCHRWLYIWGRSWGEWTSVWSSI